MHEDFICYLELCGTPFVAYFHGKLLYHLSCDKNRLDQGTTIGQRIWFYRTKGDIASNKLAERIGVSRSAMMHYENGETEPTLENLKKIAAMLDIKADKLFDEYYRFLNYPYPDKIKEIRKENKLLQRELGEKLCVTSGAIKRWENGSHQVTREMWGRLKSLGIL